MRASIKSVSTLLLLTLCISTLAWGASSKRPNILFAISDDQSGQHTSMAGYPAIQTPNFDRVANNGIYFTQAFTASPGCSPSRAAILTGRYCWQLEHAGTHGSSFPKKYEVYPDILEGAGYTVGFTGKGWGPGNFTDSGRTRNPAGPAWQDRKMKVPTGISNTDYASNFEDFLNALDDDKPFCFWYGAKEPHRVFKDGLGLEKGKKLEDVIVPSFLPDSPKVRSDILDYCAEIEWFDDHLGRMLTMLEERGELENTIVIVTSDNGMAFPRAKANMYEYGINLPLAISWGAKIPGGRVIDDLISFTDFAPTLLDAAGVKHPSLTCDAPPMVGKSLLPMLTSTKEGITMPERTGVYSARERHSSSRYKTLGYPQRGLRTHQYLYVRNFHPERWPAGTPQKMGVGGYPKDETVLGPMHGGYHDIDACPTLDFMIDEVDNPMYKQFLPWSVDKRPAEELYDIKNDPGCLNNLAKSPEFQDVRKRLSADMTDFLTQTGDPRLVGDGEIFETYKRYGKHRKFPRPE